MGQHEAGKHSKAGKAKAADNPRVRKGKKGTGSKTTTTGTGNVYQSKQGKGLIRRILGL
jgi:hypothetical protein